MIKRISQISPGPLRLLILGSFLVLFVSVLIALQLFPIQIKQELINGDWVQALDPNASKHAYERFFSIFLLATATYVFYWVIIRIVLWVIDGFKLTNQKISR